MARRRKTHDLYHLAHEKGIVVEQTIGEDEYVFTEHGTGKYLRPWIQGLDQAIAWVEQHERGDSDA